MHWVDQASVRPFRCALLPYVGNGRGVPFIDTGNDLDREHVYVSQPAAAMVAQMVGWSPPSEIESRDRRIEELERRVVELRGELDTEREKNAAIHVLRSTGFTSEQKRGPKKERQVA